MRRTKSLIIVFVSLFFLTNAFWFDRTFGDPGFESVLFQLAVGYAGTIDTDPFFFRRYALWCIVAPLMLTLIYSLNANRANHSFLITATASKLALNLGFIGAALVLLYQLGLPTFWAGYFSPDYIEAQYVPPQFSAPQSKSRQKNLVLIYLESIETNYADREIFGRNLLAPLTNLGDEFGATPIIEILPMPGAGWTIAGIVATQCGIPLKSPSFIYQDGNRIGEQMKSFLPGVTCLGDFLAAQGYHQTFMNGSQLNFAGVGKFFSTHQYDDVIGKTRWKEKNMDANNFSGWGLHDDALFREAKVELERLVLAHQPFNLTLLTIDTHFPSGLVSPSCTPQNQPWLLEIVECNMGLVAGFIKHIKQLDTNGNIQIVVVGDHLAMKNDVYDLLNSKPRHIFGQIYSNPVLQPGRLIAAQVDFFPTILDVLGFGGTQKAGLGISIFSGAKLPDDYYFQLDKTLASASRKYYDFWVSK